VAGDRYRVTVADRGQGFKPEVLKHRFEAFHQGE